MKVEEAVAKLKKNKSHKMSMLFSDTDFCLEKLNCAVEALDTAISALEKQIPQPTNKSICDSEETADRCPMCGCFAIGQFCHKCGQALEWQ